MFCSGLIADHHEGAVDVLLLEDVEDPGRPFGIGAVVKGERDLVGVVAVVLDGVGVRIDIHVLIDDELLARVGLVGVDLHGALAGLGQAGDAEDVAFAFGVDVVAGLDGAEILQRRRDCWACPRHSTCELSSEPRRQSAKVCKPSSRAARISLSRVTPSRNQTTWRWFASSSMYSKWGLREL